MEGINQEGKEKYGRNVRVVVKFLRHGERRNDDLTDAGALQIREAAAASGLDGATFDMVKPVGSLTGRKEGVQLPSNEEVDTARSPRSLVSAGLYADEVTQGYGDRRGTLRPQNLLSYEGLVSPLPEWTIGEKYNEFYNSLLPEGFDALSDDEKKEANRIAQIKVFERLTSDNSPEAEAYRREFAGASAALLLHYLNVGGRLLNNAEVMYVAGTHGGVTEYLLLEAAEKSGEDGTVRERIKDLTEIGGPFQTAESYNVELVRDDLGNEAKEFKVTFDSPNRPAVLFLNTERLQELAETYRALHPEEMWTKRSYPADTRAPNGDNNAKVSE